MLSCDITPSYRLTTVVHICILTTGAHRAWHPSKAFSRLLSECHNDYYIFPSIKKYLSYKRPLENQAQIVKTQTSEKQRSLMFSLRYEH